MNKKRCSKCKNLLPLDKFKSNPTKKDGLQSFCLDCHKEYRRKHYCKNRDKYIKKAHDVKVNLKKWWLEYKSQFSCSVCGENHPACLDFHHQDSKEKDSDVSRLVLESSRQKLLEEVAKCIPICSNCHRKLHWSEINRHE